MTVTPAEIGEQQIAALILKRMQKAEKTVAKAFRGFLSEQVRSILDDLHESQAAVVQFNPPSWDEKLIETMRPVDAAE